MDECAQDGSHDNTPPFNRTVFVAEDGLDEVERLAFELRKKNILNSTPLGPVDFNRPTGFSSPDESPDRVKKPQRSRIKSEPVVLTTPEEPTNRKKVNNSVASSSVNFDLGSSAHESSSKFYCRSQLTSTVRADKRSTTNDELFSQFMISPVAANSGQQHGRLLSGDCFGPSPIVEEPKTSANGGDTKDSGYCGCLDDSLQSMDISSSAALPPFPRIDEHTQKHWVLQRPILSAIRRQQDDLPYNLSDDFEGQVVTSKKSLARSKSRRHSTLHTLLHNTTMRQQTLTETYAIRKRSAVQPICEEQVQSSCAPLGKYHMKYQDDKENTFSSPISRHRKPDSSECKRRKHGTFALPTNFKTLDSYMRPNKLGVNNKIQHAVSIINLVPLSNLPMSNVIDAPITIPSINIEMADANQSQETIKPKPLKLSSSQRTYSVDAVNSMFQSSAQLLQSTDDILGIDMTADFSRKMLLPLMDNPGKVRHNITADTLAEVLDGSRLIPEHFKLTIIDCRYPYEYKAGHIKGAINIWHPSALEEHLFSNVSKVQACDDTVLDRKHIIIFYCEFSSQRAPAMFNTTRDLDRTHTGPALYPRLHFPEMYLLHKGYSVFFEQYSRHCDPQNYCKMHESPFKKERKNCENIRKTSTTSVKPHLVVGTTCRSKVPPPRETLRRAHSTMQVRPFRFLQFDEENAT